MKKYIIPTLLIVNIENESLLTNSDVQVLSVGNGDDALSRERSMFDWGADISDNDEE